MCSYCVSSRATCYRGKNDVGVYIKKYLHSRACIPFEVNTIFRVQRHGRPWEGSDGSFCCSEFCCWYVFFVGGVLIMKCSTSYILSCWLYFIWLLLPPYPPNKQMCSESCSSTSALYFALYKGKKCVCGYDDTFLSVGKTDGTCDTSCKGDMSISCGGYSAYDLYQLAGYTHSSTN